MGCDGALEPSAAPEVRIGPPRPLAYAPGDAATAARTHQRERAVKRFDDLFAELQEKARTRPPGSGTVAALDAGVHAIGKKIVEEAAEVWMAAEHEGPERTAEEVSQLLYHLQVLLLATGLDLDDVYAHL